MGQEQQRSAQEEKLGVVLVRNFGVATYRDPTGIRLKGQKGTSLGRQGGSVGRGTHSPGLPPFQPPGLLLGGLPGVSPLILSLR